jgi:hypothetical protein
VFGLCDMGIGTMCSVDGALVVTGAETCERGVFGAPHLSWEHGLREESPNRACQVSIAGSVGGAVRFAGDARQGSTLPGNCCDNSSGIRCVRAPQKCITSWQKSVRDRYTRRLRCRIMGHHIDEGAHVQHLGICVVPVEVLAVALKIAVLVRCRRGGYDHGLRARGSGQPVCSRSGVRAVQNSVGECGGRRNSPLVRSRDITLVDYDQRCVALLHHRLRCVSR